MTINDLSADNLRFQFSHDPSTDKYGYLNTSGTFVPFEEGGTDISDTTAVAGTVLSGYYFYTADGTKTQGLISQRSASDENVTSTKTYTAGYYPNNWTVTGGINTQDATAKAKNLEVGYTAYVKGVKITGTATGISHGLKKYSGSYSNLPINTLGSNCKTVNVGEYLIINIGSSVYKCDNSLTYTAIDSFSTCTNGVYAKVGFNNYAVFCAGIPSSGKYCLDCGELYNTQLTHSVMDGLSNRYLMSMATKNTNYMLVGGGIYDFDLSYRYNVVNAFDKQFTKSTATPISGAGTIYCSSTQGNYAMFNGVYGAGTGYSTNVISYYDLDLTKSTMSMKKSHLGSANGLYNSGNVGNYCIIHQGTNIEYIDGGMTISTKSCTKQYLAAHVTMPSYYLVATGGSEENVASTSYSVLTVDAFNTSLTLSNPSNISTKRAQAVGGCVGDFGLIMGGNISSTYSASATNKVDVYHET